MNKILPIFITFLFAISSFSATVYAQENKDFSIQEKISKQFEKLNIDIIPQYFDQLPLGTIASVNDEYITLQEVENLLDLSSTDYAEEELSLENVLDEYSIYLFEAIKQRLISQEIKANKIPVDYALVSAIENSIRESYKPTEEDIKNFGSIDEDINNENYFENELLADGISLEVWRKQLARRLEHEALQNHLKEQIVIESQEILDFYNANKAFFYDPERYHIVMFSSHSEEDLKKAHDAKTNTTEKAKEFSITAQEGNFALNNIPEEWQDVVNSQKINELSTIRNFKEAYRYIVILNKTEAKARDKATSFLQIEQALVEEKMEIVFSEWLSNALYNSKIFVSPEFLTKVKQ